MVKKPLARAGIVRNTGSIPLIRKIPGEGNCNLLQYSCLENDMDREGWWATVHGTTQSDTTEAT